MLFKYVFKIIFMFKRLKKSHKNSDKINIYFSLNVQDSKYNNLKLNKIMLII